MSAIKKLFPDRDFIKSFLTLITGNVIAQLIPVLASPLLTRMFSPADFGLLGLFMVITNSLSVIGCGRFELAILLPEKDEDGKNVFALSVFVSLISGALFFAIAFLFHDAIITRLNRPAFSSLLYLAAILVIFISIYQALNYWLIRKKEFRKNAVNRIGQTLGSTAGSIMFGLAGVPHGIVLGYAAGWIAVNFVGWFQLKTTGFNTSGISRQGIKAMFTRYRDFLTFNSFPSLLNAISTSLPTLFINLFYASQIAGYFTLARQVLLVPVSFISYATSQVFFQQISLRIQQKQSIKKEFKHLFILLGALAALMFISIFIAGPFIFRLVFGEKWVEAGNYARILALSCSLQFVVSTFSILLPALQKIKMNGLWQILYFLSILALYFLGRHQVYSFLYAYLLIDLLLYSLYLVFILNALKQYENEILKVPHEQG